MKEFDWDKEITHKRSIFALDLKGIWLYRFLIRLFVRRDFVAYYKQTVLGPLWFFIQPIFTTVIFVFIFGQIGGFCPDGVPPELFFLSGIVAWNYFADVFSKVSNTFDHNSNLFGKVYFPRLVVPISIAISSLLKFLVQFVLLLGVFVYFLYTGQIEPNYNIMMLTPIMLVIMALLGMSFGLFVASLTVKYRDFKHLVGFAIQLMMYASPVIFSLEKVSEKAGSWAESIILLNPMTSIIALFKVAYVGYGLQSFEWNYLLYTCVFTIVSLIFSILLFTRVEKNFIDVV